MERGSITNSPNGKQSTQSPQLNRQGTSSKQIDFDALRDYENIRRQSRRISLIQTQREKQFLASPRSPRKSQIKKTQCVCTIF
ncbi:hypothetical protein pb186bvf_011085 [Paramecium bursaria]